VKIELYIFLKYIIL